MTSKASDPINPNHYKFPDGTEAIQVTRWLNSNGGQAAGYVIRSTRVDDQTKRDNLDTEDLEKAIWFLQDEILRRNILKGLK